MFFGVCFMKSLVVVIDIGLVKWYFRLVGVFFWFWGKGNFVFRFEFNSCVVFIDLLLISILVGDNVDVILLIGYVRIVMLW